MTANVGTQGNETCFPHSAEGQKSKTRVWARPRAPKASRRGALPPSSSSQQPQVPLGLAAASLPPAASALAGPPAPVPPPLSEGQLGSRGTSAYLTVSAGALTFQEGHTVKHRRAHLSLAGRRQEPSTSPFSVGKGLLSHRVSS